MHAQVPASSQRCGRASAPAGSDPPEPTALVPGRPPLPPKSLAALSPPLPFAAPPELVGRIPAHETSAISEQHFNAGTIKRWLGSIGVVSRDSSDGNLS
jgi:hypothetical protein